jgi:hypothetical protein
VVNEAVHFTLDRVGCHIEVDHVLHALGVVHLGYRS